MHEKYDRQLCAAFYVCCALLKWTRKINLKLRITTSIVRKFSLYLFIAHLDTFNFLFIADLSFKKKRILNAVVNLILFNSRYI